jgi:CRISPR-associated protein Cmr3
VNLYTITPRDTLCVRDGSGSVVNTMRTLAMPWPSSLAGLFRTRSATGQDGRFEHPDPEQLLTAVSSLGPLLVRQGSGPVEELFVPAPRDVVFFGDGQGATQYRLQPLPRDPSEHTDGAIRSLELVGLANQAPKGKVVTGPMFWCWPEVEQWLLRPAERLDRDTPWMNGTGRLTLGCLAVERRTHVALDPHTQTASDGLLFSTHALRFVTAKREQLALLGGCTGGTPHQGVVTLGGERRPSFLNAAQTELPTCPAELRARQGPRYRVVLLTPGVFRAGAVPEHICGAKVVAACVPRPEVVSGWEMPGNGRGTGRPKPSRRVVPAGSVYWVELEQQDTASTWLERVWMSSVSDDAQDQRDGFGLAVVGAA